MKFKREDLQALVYDEYPEDETMEMVEAILVDTSRWSLLYEMIFKSQGKFYRTSYSTGATESQDESPFEYSPKEVECQEVEQVEELVKVWKDVEN